jgi:oligopeptide transport system substrate-binding protein
MRKRLSKYRPAPPAGSNATRGQAPCRRRQRNRTAQILWVSLLAAPLALVYGCAKTHQGPDVSQLRRGLGGEPATLDPMAAADTFSMEVLRDLDEGLTREAPDGSVVPGVAESWTMDAGGKNYSFKLRPTARWSNGQPVLAGQFVAAWRRVVDPKNGSPVADELRLVTGAMDIINGKASPDTLGVSAPDDRTLQVQLTQPASYFPQALAQPGTYPIFSVETAKGHTAEAVVSNGPYILRQWLPGSSIELKRSPFYWDRKSVGIERVAYRFQPDENVQYASFRAGQLDLTDTVPAQLVPSLRRSGAKELVLSPVLTTFYYGLNLQEPPFSNNPKLRQALSMSIDRHRLVDVLGSALREAYGFVPPGTWNYASQEFAWKNLGDVERTAAAKRLYAEAGYSGQRPLHLRLLYNANTSIKRMAVIVAAMWKETLGIDVELVEEEYRVFLESRHDPSKWDVVRLAWTADYDDAGNFLEIFRSRAATNDEGYSSAAVDGLLDSAAESADPGSRREFLESAERQVLQDQPIIPLTYMVARRLVKPYVVGVKPTLLNHLNSEWLTLRPQ